MLNFDKFYIKALKKDEQCISISRFTYRRLCFNSMFNSTDDATDICAIRPFYNDLPLTVAKITNEPFGQILYNVLKSGKSLPESLKNFKFLSVGRRIAFILVLTPPKAIPYNASAYAEAKELKDAIYLTYGFCNAFSTQEQQIYVSYFEFFRAFRLHHSMEKALLLSLCLTQENTDYRDMISLSLQVFGDMPHTLVNIKNGIINNKFNYCLMPLAISLANAIVTPTNVKDLRELFNFEIVEDKYEQFEHDNINFIFNPKLFLNSLNFKFSKETLEFVCYANDKELLLKLKDKNKYHLLKQVVEFLRNEDLIDDIKMFFTEELDIYLLYKSSTESIASHLSACGFYDDNVFGVLNNIDLGLLGLSIILYFEADTNFALCVNTSSRFCDLSKLVLNEPGHTKVGKSFNANSLLVYIAAMYIQKNASSLEDIYKLEAIKCFSPNITTAAISYIQTGTFDDTAIYCQEPNSLTSYYDRIEFASNLDFTKDDNICLFSNCTSANEVLSKAFNKNGSNLNFLHSYRRLQFGQKDLTDVNIKKIFANHEDYCDSNDFLYIEKVIISSDLTAKSGYAYTICGIVVNNYNVKKISEVIALKMLDTRKMYTYIANLVRICRQNRIDINDVDIDSVYINISNMMPVLDVAGLSKPHTKAISNNYRYRSIINLLTNSTEFSSLYETLPYQYLVPNSSSAELTQLIYASLHLQKCKKHKKWHREDDLCSECSKVFELKGSLEEFLLYTDSVSRFFYDDCVFRKGSSESRKQVLIGLENHLYDKFCGIIPCKLLAKKRHTHNGINHWGVKYTNIAFKDIIKLSDFNFMQKLKTILVMYKKLLNLILDGSFICTDQRIFDTMVMHKEYKGEILIPNLHLLECDVIVNGNEALKESKILETKQTFANFLTSFLKSDDTFYSLAYTDKIKSAIDVLDDIEKLNFSNDVIKDFLTSFNNYCITHKKFYHSTKQLCPVCEALGFNNSNVIFHCKSYFDNLLEQTATYDGGEANIFPDSDKSIEKIFKSHVDLQFKAQILAKAFEKTPLIDVFNSKHHDIRIISVKKLIYMKENNTTKLKGFTQEFVADAYKISNLKDKNFVKEHGYTRLDVLEILLKVCKGIEFLHSIGGYIGDLNGGNILIKGKNVYIIDIDGMSFDDVKNSVYTYSYIYPPSALSNNITQADDWYSLAVQAFYYLTYSHPFRGICNNGEVPENEIERMTKGTSLLGNHGIIPPSISIGWDFMPEYLYKYFLDTFEGSLRESMVSVLTKTCNYFTKVDKMFVEVPRTRPVQCAFALDSYIDSDSNLMYKEKKIATFPSSVYFKIKLSNNYTMVTSNVGSYLLSHETMQGIFVNKGYASKHIQVINRNIYYLSDNCTSIICDSLTDSGDVRSTVALSTSNIIETFFCKDHNKFVYVEYDREQSCYNVFCNSEKMYSFSGACNTFNISYDEVSNNYLILLNSQTETKCVLINGDTAKLSTFVLHSLLTNNYCSFYRNVLYYTKQGMVLSYNVITKKSKTIECKYAKDDSLIYRYDNKLVVISDNKTYVYEQNKAES